MRTLPHRIVFSGLAILVMFAATGAAAATINATIKIGLCGDGIIDSTEQCDGGELGARTCAHLGYTGGTLSCSIACEFDVASCNGASPAQVIIQDVPPATVPNVSADIRITNEGITNTEYTYEWCVVANLANDCGGGDDTYYASAAKLIVAGADFDTTLSATVPLAGTYYFKANVYFGILSSGAVRQFTAASVSSGGGGGGGGGGGAAIVPVVPQTAETVSDINHDGKVNGVDFSIMLAFWKTSPPFKNPGVDLNKDGRVDSVDFSILLYRWGS